MILLHCISLHTYFHPTSTTAFECTTVNTLFYQKCIDYSPHWPSILVCTVFTWLFLPSKLAAECAVVGQALTLCCRSHSVAQAGPSAAGCPVGCLPSYKHAVDVRSRGGDREEWLKTVGGNTPWLSGMFNWTFRIDALAGTARFWVYFLMGQRKRKKRKVGYRSCRLTLFSWTNTTHRGGWEMFPSKVKHSSSKIMSGRWS